MLAYFIIAILAATFIWLASFAEKKLDTRYRRLAVYLLYALAAITFCFFAGARNPSVGGDTAYYGTKSFEAATAMDFLAFYSDSSYSSWMPLAKTIMWASAHFTDSFFWYLFTIQLATIVPILIVCRLALKEHAFWGVLVFGILFYPMSLNLMRQLISMGWVLLSYVFIQRRKPLLFVSMIAIAALFHNSAIIALIIYPLWLIGQWNKGSMALKTIALAVLAAITVPSFIPIMSMIVPSDSHFATYITGVYARTDGGYGVSVGIIITCLVLGLAYYYLLGKQDPLHTKTPALSGLAFIVFFGAAAYPLCIVSMFLFRLGIYYLMFTILLIPMAMMHLQPKRSKTLFGAISFTMISGFSICYYAGTLSHGVVPYVFGL